MLVIISDLHLTDGSSGATISADAFRIFARRLRDLAVSASWRVDDTYRPIDRIDLVLLGDVLDVIRSSRWSHQSQVRPWDNPQQREFIEVVTNITSDILRHNEESLSVLRGLSVDGAITIPPANQAHQPAHDAEGQAVSVHTHYMVGNHDWFYHLPGNCYDLLRQALVRQMGLANAHDRPFPHDPAEDGDLLEVMHRHKVFARHGDQFDPFNFEGDRDASSLGDCIVVELLNRFATSVELEMADDLPAGAILGLRELDNVRPLMMVPVWIDGLLERTCTMAAGRKQVKKIWDSLADDFLSQSFVRNRDTWNPNDLVDGLQRALKFSKRIPIGWASSIIEWMNQLKGTTGSSYYKHALAEADFRNRRARHIVYGHTHNAETVPLDASYADGYVLNQVYFNSGTWRRVHRPTQQTPGEHEFIASDVMTYLAFFAGGERSGRPFETWSGTLAVAPSDISQYRVDSGRHEHAPRQQPSTPGLLGHGPHFNTSSKTVRVSRGGN